MKDFSLLLLCGLMSSIIVAQNQEISSDTLAIANDKSSAIAPYPQGCYMSLEEILDKKPSKQLEIKLIQREENDIFYYGGNNYKLSSTSKNIKSRVLKKDIWAVSDGKDLFFNGYRFIDNNWYAKIDLYGYYLAFKGRVLEKTRLFVFNTKSGRVLQVSKKSMPSLLKNYPDLLAAFEKEQDTKSLEVLQKYIHQLNQILNTPIANLPINNKQNVKSDSLISGGTALTVGFLEGGSLLGVELETMLGSGLGLEAGFGFRGFSAGMNIHFKNTLKSNAINIFYQNQGFAKSFSQRLIGAGFTFRGKKGLTAHLGMAYALQRSEALERNLQSPVVFTFSFGFYTVLGGH